MNIVKVRDEIRTLADRWLQYIGPGRMWPEDADTYRQLLRMDVETVAAEQAAQIIGEVGWLSRCHECGGYKPVQVVFGPKTPQYGRPNYNVCPDCLRLALEVVEAVEASKPVGFDGIGGGRGE